MPERPNWINDELNLPIEPVNGEEARVLIAEAHDLVGTEHFSGDELDRFTEIMILLLGGVNMDGGISQQSHPFQVTDEGRVIFERTKYAGMRLSINFYVTTNHQQELLRYIELKERDADFKTEVGPILECSPMLEESFKSRILLERVIENQPEKREYRRFFELRFTSVSRFCMDVLNEYEHSEISSAQVPAAFYET